MRHPLLLIAVLLAAAAPAPTVAVGHPWARATAPGQTTGVVYATLLSPAGDTLLGVASPEAAMAMLHREVSHDGMASMQAMDQGLALPPNQAVALSPGGMHIMLSGLKHPLVAGAGVPVTFSFAHAGSIAMIVPVQPLGATGPTP